MTSKSAANRLPLLFVAALASATALTVVAEESAAPTTQPSALAATSRPAQAHANRRLLANRGLLSADMPTDEEWRSVVELMNHYSPNRLKVVAELSSASPESPRVAGLRKTIWLHYRDLQLARERNDEELYNLKLQLIQKEDEVWALQRQFRDAADADRPVMRYNLRQRVGELVRLNLKERELRIARLEKALAEEKEKLAADERSVNDRVEERMRGVTASSRRPNDRRRDDGAAGGSGGGGTSSQPIASPAR